MLGTWLTFFFLIACIIFSVSYCNTEKGRAERNGQLIGELRQNIFEVEQREKESNARMDALFIEIYQRDSVIEATKQVKEKVAAELHQTKARVIFLAGKIKDGKQATDTQSIVINCDSLVDENYNLIGLVSEYETYADSLLRMYERQGAAKDSIISDRQKLYSDLRISFNKVSADYLQLLQKPPKVSRWNKWIKPTIAALAAGVITSQLTK